MGLESGSFLDDLVVTNPLSGDPKAQGDDHLRLIKSLLTNTFPNADKAFYFPTTEAKTATFVVASTDLNKTFLVDTASGEVTATLPTLTAGDAGWTCHFIKTNTGTNALFIAPASGTLQSGEVTGLAQCRRVIPGHRCSAIWGGSAWYVTRVPNVPIGSCIEFHGTTLPVGYEWPTGQTLTSASTKYPEFYAVNGNSGVTLDRQERVAAMADKTGVSRLTDQSGGVSGTFGDTGGAETHTLTEAQLAAHTHTADVTDAGHTHAFTRSTGTLSLTNGVAGTGYTQPTDSANEVLSATTGILVSNDNTGDDEAHNNVQPTIITNFILVVE